MRGPKSLRRQLLLLGFIAVVLPVLTLFVIVAATISSEEISVADDGREMVVAQESTAIPREIILGAVLVSAVGCVVVWVWAGRAVRPMAKITAVANEIQAGSLDRRIDLDGGTVEVQALADSFDGMLHRLSHASTTQQQLIEDASHELRTPLAALAVNNEIILSKADPSPEDYRESAQRNEALIARLQMTIDDLLVDARDRSRRAQQVGNDLVEIVARVVDQHRAVNPAIPIIVRAPKELHLGIDGPSVQRALVNLVENAARYSPPGVPVEIDVVADVPSISVTDHGPGIASDQREAIFDRYFQGPDGGGAGIGLALVKQVAEANGSIEVTSPLGPDRPGTRFTIFFSSGQG